MKRSSMLLMLAGPLLAFDTVFNNLHVCIYKYIYCDHVNNILSFLFCFI